MTTQTPDPEQAEQQTPVTKVRRPRWQQPETDPSTEAPSPSDPSPSLEAAPADGSDAGGSDGPSEQKRGDRRTSSGSSRTSSRAELRQAVRVAVAGVTTIAHELIVRDPYAKYAELLLADEQDLDAISEPGGNLIARRIPKDAPLGGDLGDVIALAVGAAGYLLKQVGRIRYARQLRDQGAAVEGFQPDLGPDDRDADAAEAHDLIGRAQARTDFPLPE